MSRIYCKLIKQLAFSRVQQTFSLLSSLLVKFNRISDGKYQNFLPAVALNSTMSNFFLAGWAVTSSAKPLHSVHYPDAIFRNPLFHRDWVQNSYYVCCVLARARTWPRAYWELGWQRKCRVQKRGHGNSLKWVLIKNIYIVYILHPQINLFLFISVTDF